MPEDFDTVENRRIVILSTRNLRGWEGLFLAVREGVLPPGALDVIGGGGAFQAPYVREIWPRLRPSLTGDFADYMEERFGLGS